MPRPKLNPGQIGDINVKRIGERKWRARARVCCHDGVVRQVQADAQTKYGARDKVRQAAERKAAPPAIEVSLGPTLGDIVRRSLDRRAIGEGGRPADEVRMQSFERYERTLGYMRGEHGDPNIADELLADVNPRKITKWLEEFGLKKPAIARQARVVLSRALDEAIRYGEVDWPFNPASAAKLRRKAKNPVEVLSPEQVQLAHAAARRWQTDWKSTDLVGVVAVLAVTGMRPSEVLALRWVDLDLEHEPALLTVSGTVVRHKGGADGGGGLVRQQITKTKAGLRVLELEPSVAAMLKQRRAVSDSELVFPNKSGGLMGLDSLNRRWREARGEELAGVELRAFRRTVATAIADHHSPDEAARQLGHSSSGVTQTYYIKRALAAGDYTDILADMAPAQIVQQTVQPRPGNK